MSAPASDNEFLYELELEVRTELTQATTGSHPDDHPSQAEVPQSAASQAPGPQNVPG